MLDMNIAVIGAPASGKSAFMRKALGLSDATPPNECHRKWSIDNIQHVVRLVELNMDEVQVKTGNAIEWPKTAHGAPVPRIDAAITVYDVTVKESLAGVPEMMSAYTDCAQLLGSATDTRKVFCPKPRFHSFLSPANATNTPRTVKSIQQSSNRKQRPSWAKSVYSKAPLHPPTHSENV